MPVIEEIFEFDVEDIQQRAIEGAAWIKDLDAADIKDDYKKLVDRIMVLGFEVGMLVSACCDLQVLTMEERRVNELMVMNAFTSMVNSARGNLIKANKQAEAENDTDKH